MTEPPSGNPPPELSDVTSEIPRVTDEPPAPVPPAPEPGPSPAGGVTESSVTFGGLSLPPSPYAPAGSTPPPSPYAAPGEPAPSDPFATAAMMPVEAPSEDGPDEPQAGAAGPEPAMRYFAADPAPQAATATLTAAPPLATPASNLTDDRESITCPECGTVATVSLSRRDSTDFCRSCDYPLFWTPAKIQLDRAGLSDDSLRRLPGTVGRVAVASFPCPHCSELNAVSAVTCIRCGLPLHPVRVEAPAPVYVPPPPMPVYEEPERRTPWWVWFLIGFVVVATVTLVVLYLTDTIG